MPNRKSSTRYTLTKRLKEFPLIAIAPSWIRPDYPNTCSATLTTLKPERVWLFKTDKDRHKFLTEVKGARLVKDLPAREY